MSDAWREALRFAALPSAATVRLERQSFIDDGTPTINYRLTSLTATGETVGDDRDYDLLKAAMRPLEKLAENCDHEALNVELDLKTGLLTGPTHG